MRMAGERFLDGDFGVRSDRDRVAVVFEGDGAGRAVAKERIECIGIDDAMVGG